MWRFYVNLVQLCAVTVDTDLESNVRHEIIAGIGQSSFILVSSIYD